MQSRRGDIKKGTLGDHVTITLDVEVTDSPVEVEYTLPDELSYIPDTLEVVGGPATCTTSEHEIVWDLLEDRSYMITFDVQVTRANGLMGTADLWPLPSPDDLEGEDIIVENTVRIGGESTTETLTITPFDGFYQVYINAWLNEEDPLVRLADLLDVPTNTDVLWDIGVGVFNWPGDYISEMTSVVITDKLGDDIELDADTLWTLIGMEDADIVGADPANVTGKKQKVRLTWEEIPPLADDDAALAHLEISTNVNPKTGQQEFADEVLTEHELNSGALLKFVDPETGLHLRADIPPIVVTADPNWGEE